jgi:hypothetical protein
MVSYMDLGSEGILYDFEGNPVTAVGVEIRNAAGGLNEALEVDKIIYHGGDTVLVLLRCDVVEIDHKPIKGDESNWRRIHVMRATDATTTDSDQVLQAINAQRQRIQFEREKRQNIERLFPDVGDSEGHIHDEEGHVIDPFEDPEGPGGFDPTEGS